MHPTTTDTPQDGRNAATPRLRAVCDLLAAEVRDRTGRHEYDGRVQDLSPEAVSAGLARLGGPQLEDPYDEALLSAAERRLQVELGEVQLHRRSPRLLLAALDLSGYDRPYAPEPERARARRAHLAAWPEAIDAALPGLDLVSAPAARALLPSVHGAAGAVPPDDPATPAALAAHGRLVAHLERCARDGDPDPAIGGEALTRLLGDADAQHVELAELAEVASAERERLRAQLHEGCARLRPGVAVSEVLAELVRDHPTADGVLDEARELTEEVIAFTRERGLVDHLDGECLVQPSPESKRWATAMLTWPGPYEADGPSIYAITPPDPGWEPERQRAWLRGANRTTMPSTTAHEVAPGHFAHGRALRRLSSDVRRTVHSSAFIEGWAHYAEELMVEEGFRGDDPRFAVGVALKALMRVVRLSVSIGVHTRALTVEDAVGLFEADAYLQRPVAEAEAARSVHDPTYGRYTLGKLAVRSLREQAKALHGSDFDLLRFHRSMLELGSPPLGLLPRALEGPRG